MRITSAELHTPIKNLTSASQRVASGSGSVIKNSTDQIVALESFKSSLGLIQTRDKTLGTVIDLKA